MTGGIQTLQIVGQGLAGCCLAWYLHWRGVPFTTADHGAAGSSRMAAGLINPITGKNFEPSWRIEDFHPEAIAFYRRVEETIRQKIWHPLPVMRLALTATEWNKIESKFSSPRVVPWLTGSATPTPQGFHESVELGGGGWLDTAAFLEGTARYFSSNSIPSPLPGSPVILCEGASGLLRNQLGSHRCAKGEILTVQAEWPDTHIRIGAGGWMVPIGDGCFRVGSTYEWNQLDCQPTEGGGERIAGIARKIGGEFSSVISHVAGIRPILRRSEPLIGKNGDGAWIFNGLGSKGTLYAPEMARMLTRWILDDTPPEEIFIISDPIANGSKP